MSNITRSEAATKAWKTRKKVMAMRSKAAKKAWATRRSNDAAERRSIIAKKAAVTRRKNAKNK